MAPKRGRPLSTDSADPSIARRRHAQREWVRQARARKRNEQSPSRPRLQLSAEQLQQGELIVDLAINEDEDAAITLTQLGLRVQDVTLAQDPYDAQLQERAVPSDDHESQYADDYHDDRPARPQRRPSLQVSSPPPKQTTDVGFFRQFARSRTRSPAARGRAPTSAIGDLSSVQRRMSQYFTTLPARSQHCEQSGQEQGPSRVSALIPHGPSSSTEAVESLTQEQGIERISTDDAVTERHQDPLPVQTLADEIAIADDEALMPSDHESVVEFASQHSENGDSEAGLEVRTAHELMVEKLCDQLIGGFHGCTTEDHERKMREHMQAADEDHHGLDEIFHDDSFPSVLELSDMLTPERLARQQNPSPRQWKAMFCGTSAQGQRRLPMNVCLHKEETQAIAPQVAFDVDSFLGFASSLAIARRGLWYQPVPLAKQNIVADNHVEMSVPQGGEGQGRSRSHLRMLRDVPHFLLGRVVGSHDITVHVLFPHLQAEGRKFVSLTHEQLTRWVDQVYLPALHEFYDAHYTQHLPASFRHAHANSKAHQVEDRQIETASYQAQQSIGYHLQPRHLDAIWSHVLRQVEQTPGLADFREPQLFFSARGTKLQFKTDRVQPSLLDAIDTFRTFFEDVIDMRYVEGDRLYVDIGKEICPPDSSLPSRSLHIEEQPQVYSWKRCCLEQYLQWMYGEQMPGRHGTGQVYFTQNMLYDACALTSVTPKLSRQREGGLIYSQFYASVKEIVDATKCFPFSNDGMEEMALDPLIRSGARNIAGGRRREAQVVERAYLASKRRTRDALHDSRGKSFGIREEHRVSWELFAGLQEWLQAGDDRQEIVLDDCPSYAWAIQTSTYIDYLWRSVDKFATGFEVVRARCNPQVFTWEETKTMAMFLRCLRFVFGGHLLSRESALWWGRRDRTVGEQARVWYGLGFSNTLPRYGYCWLEPRVDWVRLQFKEQVTDRVLFGNSVLRGQYLRRGRQVGEFIEITRQLDIALDWLRRYLDNERVRRRMLLWMIHICLWQFRLDILAAVKVDISRAHHEVAMRGLEGFSYEYFVEIMQEPVHLMVGNRCAFKDPHLVWRLLYGRDDTIRRNHWEHKPYRVLHRRACEAARMIAPDVARTFERRFHRTLYRYHWVLPYPHGDGLVQTTKQGRRMWYSIETRNEVSLAAEKDWRWAGKGWQVGRPPDVPAWLLWPKDRWESWLQGRDQG